MDKPVLSLTYYPYMTLALVFSSLRHKEPSMRSLHRKGLLEVYREDRIQHYN